MAATGNGAEFLRIADTGTLDAGKRADYIVLNANPLDNIPIRGASRRCICTARPSIARSRSPSVRLPLWLNLTVGVRCVKYL